MKTEKMKRTLALAYVATGITQIAEIGYNYLLYKSFPIDEIGLFAWAAAVIVFFNMAIDLGLEPILTRKFGRDPLPLNRAVMATFLPRAPIIFVGAGVATALYIFGQFDSDKYLMLVLIGAQAIFNVSDGVCKAWLRANGRQTIANFLAAMIGALKLTAIVVLTRLESGTIIQLLVSLLVIRAVGSLLVYRLVLGAQPAGSDERSEPLFGLSGDLLKAGVVVGGISVLTAVQNRFDWLLVSHFISTEALATYSLANKFYEISQVLVGAALITIYPWLCRADTNSALIFIVMRLVLAGGAILGACGAILAPPLISILFASKYSDIGLPVVILMLAVGIMATSGVLYQLALARGHERSLLVATIITTTIQATANLWLIPRFGITGAALGMLLLVVSTAIGISVVVWKHGLLSGQVILRIFAFLTTFMCLTCLVLNSALPVWFAVLSCVIGIAFAAWWLLFEGFERRILQKHIKALLT